MGACQFPRCPVEAAVDTVFQSWHPVSSTAIGVAHDTDSKNVQVPVATAGTSMSSAEARISRSRIAAHSGESGTASAMIR